MKKYVIIVAGGKGLRMGGEVPKQFLPVKGRPVLMRTLDAFYAYDASVQLILVLPLAQKDYWMSLCASCHFDVPYRLAEGGETRFHSVANGLSLVPDDEDCLVAVHDGVRPFVSKSVIDTCFRMAEKTYAVVPVIPVVETVRRLDGTDGQSRTVNRADYRLVQTPQTFDGRLLKKAYAQPYRETFTDDASVVEALGSPVTLVEGNRENIKLTTPFDLKIAEALLSD